MIKSIIFDLGGVIEKIYPNKVLSEFKILGIDDAANFYSLYGQSAVCDQFEKGYIGKDIFIQYIKENSSKKLNDKEIVNAWCKNQGGVDLHTLRYLQELKKTYNLYLLSNTNIIHYDFILENFTNSYNINLESLFDDIFLSFKMGKRKPSCHTFKYVFDQLNFNNEEMLYVDDLEMNCIGAKKLGVHTYQHPTNSPLKLIQKVLSTI